MKISVSFLKNKNGISKTLEEIDKSNADYIHVDLIDKTFTNTEFLRDDEIVLLKNLNHKLDVHLMCMNPISKILEFSKLNTEYITVHVEIKNAYEALSLIKLKGIKCGVALNPETEVSAIKPYLAIIDKVIILGVNPGMGGATLIDSTISKIDQCVKIREENNLNFDITFDGGVNIDTVYSLLNADTLVSGSFVVMSDNYNEQINSLRELTSK